MNGKASAVHDDMEWFPRVYPCIQERFQRLTSAGDCGVVRCWEFDIHDVKNGMDEAFSLPQRKVKEET